MYKYHPIPTMWQGTCMSVSVDLWQLLSLTDLGCPGISSSPGQPLFQRFPTLQTHLTPWTTRNHYLEGLFPPDKLNPFVSSDKLNPNHQGKPHPSRIISGAALRSLATLQTVIVGVFTYDMFNHSNHSKH